MKKIILTNSNTLSKEEMNKVLGGEIVPCICSIRDPKCGNPYCKGSYEIDKPLENI